MDDELENFLPNREEDYTCPVCRGSGRVPSTEDQAARGIQYVACEECDAGTAWADDVGEI